MLGGALPIEVTRSNVEATKEDGEDIGFFAAGHSVWFEWEAPSSGWVTLGTCDSDFDTTIAVFTGSALGALTKVAAGSGGFECPFPGEVVTFRATAGTSYVVAVDGESTPVPPEAPRWPDEGELVFRLEATPPSPNDDFGAAVVLGGGIYEEPGGTRFQIVSDTGYNWGATKEAGEPSHGGDPGGASVWYAWTAPESGFARVSVCCSGPTLVGVYLGESVGVLTPVEPATMPPFVRAYPVSAGTTYRIAIDGERDAGTGEAEMGAFDVRIFMGLAPRVPQSPLSEKDVAPPNTTIRRRVLKRKPPILIFSFASTEPGSTFQCKLDKRPFRKCGSSKTFRRPRPGRHVLRVRAIDPSGNVDPTPAVARFRGPVDR